MYIDHQGNFCMIGVMKDLNSCQDQLRLQAEKCRGILSRSNDFLHKKDEKKSPVKSDVATSTSFDEIATSTSFDEIEEFQASALSKADLLQKELDDYKDLVEKLNRDILRLQSEAIQCSGIGANLNESVTDQKKTKKKKTIFATPLSLNSSIKSTVSSAGGNSSHQSRDIANELIDSLDWVQVSDEEDANDDEDEDDIYRRQRISKRSNASSPGIDKSPSNSTKRLQKSTASSPQLLSPSKSAIHWATVTNRHDFIAQNKQNISLLNHAMKVLTKEETSNSFVKATLRHAVLQEGPSLTPVSVGSTSPHPSHVSLQSSSVSLSSVLTEEDFNKESHNSSSNAMTTAGIAEAESSEASVYDVLSVSTSWTGADDTLQSHSKPPLSPEPSPHQQTLPAVQEAKPQKTSKTKAVIKDTRNTTSKPTKSTVTRTKNSELGKVSRHGKIDFILENKIEVKRTSDSVHYLRSAASLPPASHLSSSTTTTSNPPISSHPHPKQTPHQHQPQPSQQSKGLKPHISPVLHRATLAAIKREISHDTRQQFLQLASSAVSLNAPETPAATPNDRLLSHNASSSALLEGYDVKKIQALAERTQSMFELPLPPPPPPRSAVSLNRTPTKEVEVEVNIEDTVPGVSRTDAEKELLAGTVNPMRVAAPATPPTITHHNSDTPLAMSSRTTHDTFFNTEVTRNMSRSMSRPQLLDGRPHPSTAVMTSLRQLQPSVDTETQCEK